MFQIPSFPTNYEAILARIHSINPIEYGRTRNHLEGAVTHISPYLTHGVISLPQVRSIVHEKFSAKDSYTFIFELAWREFFQRVYMEEGSNIFNDLKSAQVGVTRYGIPKSILNISTGIKAIDESYQSLQINGYMHNHARMWSAMLIANVGHYEWWDASRHMFYHLLDGDKASNTLSWQWVAGSFSSKQYVANQEMINKFTKEKQNKSYLDIETELLTTLDPVELHESVDFELRTDFSLFSSDNSLSEISNDSVLLYSIWTLDPTWKKEQPSAAKVLFIDTDELTDFPISPKRISFILELSKNIPDLKIILGTHAELLAWSDNKSTSKIIYRKDHPAIYDWPGIASEPEYLFPEIVKVPRGFMSYWKKCEPYL